MKIFVISLEERKDRREHIRKVLSSYDYTFFDAINGNIQNPINLYDYKIYGKWLDPLLNRKLNRGEIGTAVSHYKLWEKISLMTEPAIIVEDDVILCRQLDMEEITKDIQDFDMLYLGYREMYPDKVKSANERILIPYYPYLASSYVITPEFAKQLVESNYKNNIIPVDEFFPILNGVDYNNYCLSSSESIKNIFLELKKLLFIENVKIGAYNLPFFNQVPREILGSDIEKSYENNVYFTTVATEEIKALKLLDSAHKNNIKVENIGKNITWEGGNLTIGVGGGHKLNLVKKYIKSPTIFEDDIVVFLDGYDVIINDDLQTIYERFKSFNCDILFAAEKNCWPDKSLEPLFTAPTDYKYINSGCYIGYRWALDKFFDVNITNREDDQLFCQKRYLVKNGDDIIIKIDSENYIFQCVANATEDIKIINGQLLNTSTRACPCILHGNGGQVEKTFFNKTFNTLFPLSNKIDLLPFNLVEIQRDIVHSKFLDIQSCNTLIRLAEDNGKWKSLDYDTFPAKEIRIRDISLKLFSQLEEHLLRSISPSIEKYWHPLLMYGIRDAFIIKYSPKTQSGLGCHHDASLVSGIVKLNDGYEGGDTYFHRQEYSNIDVPVGDIILWPGQVTHGHAGRKVTKGTKYNLVIWTSRFMGDVNF